MLKIKYYLTQFTVIFILMWLIVCISVTSFAGILKTKQQPGSRDLIVGELLGKVDPDDLWELIETGYYPVIRANSGINLVLVKKSKREVIFRAIYPGNISTNCPQRIVFKFFESEHSLTSAIITDKVDFAFTESDDVADEVHKSNLAYYIQFRYKKPNFVKMVSYNNRQYILKNKSVRKALTYAIDRDGIFNKLLKQHAYHADGPILSRSKNHAPGLKEYRFIPKTAIQLLQAEGWRDVNRDGILEKNGIQFRITLTYEKGVLLDEKIARKIKNDWNKLGVDVIRNPLNQREIKAKLVNKDYDVMLMNHQFNDDFESFEKYFKSTSKYNFLGYRNRTTDKYIHLYHGLAPSSKGVMFQAIQNQINKDHPAAFLFFLWLDRYFINRAKFTNYRTKEIKLLPFTEWKFR